MLVVGALGLVWLGLFGLVAGLGPLRPSPVAAAPTSSSGTTYTVRSGDTLTSIGRRLGVTVEALRTANGLADGDHLLAGTVLTVPSRSSSGSTSTSTRGGSRYTIRAGDTWWGIARRYGIAAADLAAANGSSLATTIYTGRSLVIPARSQVAEDRSARAAAPNTAAYAGVYTVRPGDTLTGIATRYGTTVALLAEANGLGRNDVLLAGTNLRVPAAATVASTPSRSGLPAKLTAHPERLALLPVFDRAAAEFGIPADLLKSVAYMESGWNPGVISYKGAMGIGQLMPATAAEMARRMGDPSLDPWDAADNIRMSARYLRYLLDLNGGNSSGALAAYYQGHVSVLARGLDVDTQNYVKVIQANRPLFT